MAIYHLSAQAISRATGRSATAAAAYRAGEQIHDQRSGQTHDYRRRKGVEHCEILSPAHAPDWARDRSRLWNQAEQTERRKDAQLCREIVVALPAELDAGQRLTLIRDFCQNQFVRQGMIADLAIHQPGRQGDRRNHHAHILLSLREIGPDGFGLKNRQWNQRDQLNQWRAAWADAANQALAAAGHSPRIDHRSLAAQGHDRRPGQHQGPAVTALARRAWDDRIRRVLHLPERPGGAGVPRVLDERHDQTRQLDQRAQQRRDAQYLHDLQQQLAQTRPGDGIHCQRQAELDCARDLQARGQPLIPQNRWTLEKAGGDALLAWAAETREPKAIPETPARLTETPAPAAAAPQPAAEPPGLPAADLLKAWKQRHTQLVQQYRQRAQHLTRRLEQQIHAIEQQRENARTPPPQAPGGLLGLFRQRRYQHDLADWQARDQQRRHWKQPRLDDLTRRQTRLQHSLAHSAAAADARLRREQPGWAARLPEARAECQRQHQQQQEQARQQNARNDFQTLARKRADQTPGYGDRGGRWRRLPDPLRQAIEAYNQLPAGDPGREIIVARVVADTGLHRPLQRQGRGMGI